MLLYFQQNLGSTQAGFFWLGWLTFGPELSLTPEIPRHHAPLLLAVLISDGIVKRQDGKHVRHIVTSRGQVDLSAGLYQLS